MYHPVEIGTRMKSRREALSLTLDDVAASVKVAKSTIQRYESGAIMRIKLPVVNAIAAALQVNPDWLLGLTDHMREEKTAVRMNDGLSPMDAKLLEYLRRLSEDQKKFLLAQIETLLKSQE